MNTYIFYAKLLEEIAYNRSNYKSLILTKCQARGFSPPQIKKTYSIILNSHQNLSSLQQILQNFLSVFPNVKINNCWLFFILLHEFFREQNPEDSKKSSLKGGGYLIRIIKKHNDFLRKEISSLKINPFIKSFVKDSVYIRFIAKRTDIETISKEINEKTGTIINIKKDSEIPNLISIDYEGYSKGLCQNEAVSDRKDLIIQGKSSCYPAWVLFKSLLKKKIGLKKRFDVLDACAAPGNKTLQLSEYLSEFSNSKLFVFEKNLPRFQLLEKRLNHYSIIMDRTHVYNSDFLSIDPQSSEFSHVKLLLLDPSCSGSGMRNHLFLNDQITKKADRKNKFFESNCNKKYEELDSQAQERVGKLQGFQLNMLSHAMRFTNVIRICYSTCSLYCQENEIVVERILENNPGFKLINLRRKFEGLQRGFGKIGKKCLRADPFSDDTDGFFVALFKRI